MLMYSPFVTFFYFSLVSFELFYVDNPVVFLHVQINCFVQMEVAFKSPQSKQEVRAQMHL